MKNRRQFREDMDMEDPWRVFRIMAEFVEGFSVLSEVGPAITFFGSARLKNKLVPGQQSRPWLEKGTLADLAPERQLPVRLFWHCWSIESVLLKKLTRCLIQTAPAWLSP